MKEYNVPALEIVGIDKTDVIATSNFDPDTPLMPTT